MGGTTALAERMTGRRDLVIDGDLDGALTLVVAGDRAVRGTLISYRASLQHSGGSMEQDEHGHELLNVEDVLALLRAEVAKSGSQIEWARQHSVDRSCVCAAINGTKPLQPKIIRALGLKATIAYTRL
jgi:hypothetical protein